MTTYQTRRTALGLRREDIAVRAGVSFSTVIRAENGKPISPLAERAIQAALAEAEAKKETA